MTMTSAFYEKEENSHALRDIYGGRKEKKTEVPSFLPIFFSPLRVCTSRHIFPFSTAHPFKMGKRKAKKRSNSTLKLTSYFKRFQVKFARRRVGRVAHDIDELRAVGGVG